MAMSQDFALQKGKNESKIFETLFYERTTRACSLTKRFSRV